MPGDSDLIQRQFDCLWWNVSLFFLPETNGQQFPCAWKASSLMQSRCCSHEWLQPTASKSMAWLLGLHTLCRAQALTDDEKPHWQFVNPFWCWQTLFMPDCSLGLHCIRWKGFCERCSSSSDICFLFSPHGLRSAAFCFSTDLEFLRQVTLLHVNRRFFFIHFP